MMRSIAVFFWFCAIALQSVSSFAQNTAESWQVWKVRHGDLSGSQDRVVATFANETEATARANELNQRNNELGYIYEARVVATGGLPPARPSGNYAIEIENAYARARRARAYLRDFTGKMSESSFNDMKRTIDQFNGQFADVQTQGLEIPAGLAAIPTVTAEQFADKILPEIKSVLPGWSKIPELIFTKRDQSNGTTESVAGKEAEGKVGTSKVKVVYEGNGENGKLSISGEMNEQGKWRQLGQFLQIETENARYVGKIEGSTISGSRKSSDNSTTKWSVVITDINRQLEGEWYKLFTGQYSNTADTDGGGSGQSVASLQVAQANAASHMSSAANKQPSYRIEDRNGKVIEARGLFRNMKADSATSASSASPTPTNENLCYICWLDDFAGYGGASKQEALDEGRKSKRMNPSTHIRVTEHQASSRMTIDEISKTPGTTLLDLP